VAGASGGKLVVVSGPSGVGKSTVLREVRRRTGAAFSVSVTTRPPRPGERNGEDYLFVDRPTFEKMIADGELLEWAEVFGDLYGTPAAPVREALAAGRTLLLDIDVQGARQVHRKMPTATFVLIVPPSDERLRQRLCGRNSESPRAVRQRLDRAKAEVQAAEESGIYGHTVVNDELERAVADMAAIVTQESNEL